MRRFSALTLRRLFAISLAAVLVTTFGMSTPSRATGADREASVSTIAIHGAYTELSLSFDRAIPADTALRLEERLAGPAQVTVAIQSADAIYCGEFIRYFDSNGVFSVQYNCSGTRSLPWGFQISTAVQSIIVGNVNETGLRWWINGYPMPQNAPHVVPPDYLFHGTMTPLLSLSYVDCQDYMTFRHNLGGGGTGTLTFAASLWLAQ